VSDDPIVQPPLNPDIHIEADIPGRGEPGHVDKIAEVFQAGLSMASSSPSVRLKMILGEAYQKYGNLLYWLAEEIVKDDDKAPGLIQAAQQYARDPSILRRSVTTRFRDITDAQQRLLEDALRFAASALWHGTRLEALEDKTCSDPVEDT
jgi:hypothetical protein